MARIETDVVLDSVFSYFLRHFSKSLDLSSGVIVGDGFRCSRGGVFSNFDSHCFLLYGRGSVGGGFGEGFFGFKFEEESRNFQNRNSRSLVSLLSSFKDSFVRVLSTNGSGEFVFNSEYNVGLKVKDKYDSVGKRGKSFLREKLGEEGQKVRVYDGFVLEDFAGELASVFHYSKFEDFLKLDRPETRKRA